MPNKSKHTTAISLRISNAMLERYKELGQSGVGYQTLMKEALEEYLKKKEAIIVTPKIEVTSSHGISDDELDVILGEVLK